MNKPIALSLLLALLSVAFNAQAASSEEIMRYLEKEKKVADSGGDYLRKSLVMLHSSNSEFQAFKEKGGFEYKSQWRGYEISELSMSYKDDKLSYARISLGKNQKTGKLASIENIRADFNNECNSALELSRRHNPYSNRDVYDSGSDLFLCTFFPIDGGVVGVSIVIRSLQGER